MENEAQNLERGTERDARQSHPTRPGKLEAKETFEALLTMLGVASHIDAVQLFVGRVPYHTIVDWRRGRHAIPQWAFGYLATLLRQRASVLLNGAEIGDNPPSTARGQGSHGNILAWNKRRAALKNKT